MQNDIPTTFTTRIAIILREDLATWQKLNVTAFLAGGLGGSDPALMGDAYLDADGTRYGALIVQPVLIFASDGDEIKRAHATALERGATLFVYTREMFSTGHDAANRAAVAAVPRADLDLVGIALRDSKATVTKVTKGLKLHP
ncbi:DUF2000 family protein [Rhabdaerophilum sp. SD176]|uniref:DUF2000 family protein n=1 Tax=Rhabdaerophilum sp. SD176 TaxID=2983548 RepID=UPI0024DFF1BD|nr:DUF2000 family protein [Rhabdaerophilum sp. SD176]